MVNIVSFYRYINLNGEANRIKDEIADYITSKRLLGRLLIAEDGVNGTFCGSEAETSHFISFLTTLHHSFGLCDYEYSYTKEKKLFPDFKVALVREIVGTGRPNFKSEFKVEYDDSTKGGICNGGIHLSPNAFDKKIEEGAIIIDIRNEYEYDIGHFDGAHRLPIDTYTETWKALDRILEDEKHQNKSENKPVLMYCTGGVRCELASVYVKQKTKHQVYQLDGGINNYLKQKQLEEIEEKKEEEKEKNICKSKFKGKMFVFDARVTNDIYNGDVVGRCIECYSSWDQFSGLIVCTVCRALVLVCPKCLNDAGEYHCKRHRGLRNCYFTKLTRFTTAELESHKEELLLLQTSTPSSNRRRTLRRQIEKIDNYLNKNKIENENNDKIGEEDGKHRNGDWGFWAARPITYGSSSKQDVSVPTSDQNSDFTSTSDIDSTANRRGSTLERRKCSRITAEESVEIQNMYKRMLEEGRIYQSSGATDSDESESEFP